MIESDPHRTENGCGAYRSTGSALVDLFVQCRRGATRETLLPAACYVWNQDPQAFVQLLCYTRDIREGKGEKAVSHILLRELRRRAPDTYERNMDLFYGELGCFKDLLCVADKDDCAVEVRYMARCLLAGDSKALLAAKWCPGERGPYRWFARALARGLYGSAHWARLRKELLSPLRARLDLVETKMCANAWDQIVYEHVPAKASILYRHAFERHDKDRYDAYRNGRTGMRVSGVHPHELVAQIWKESNGGVDPTIEGQWKALVEHHRAQGSWSRTLAVVDVSGSMLGQPMQVAISLGIFLAQLCEGPFHQHVMPFSDRAQLVRLQGETLADHVQQLKQMTWSVNTDLLAVFRLLLVTATLYEVPPEKMIDTVMVFTDMEFDQAHAEQETLSTAYEAIQDMFRETPYTCPRLVFWNLKEGSADQAFPVTSQTPGTVVLSGFSPALLSTVLTAPRDITPEAFVRACIAPYQDRVVLSPMNDAYFPWMQHVV